MHGAFKGEEKGGLPVVSITEMAWPGYTPGEVEGVGETEGVAAVEMVPVCVAVGVLVPVGLVEPVKELEGVRPEVTLAVAVGVRVRLTVGVFDACSRVGREKGRERVRKCRRCGVRGLRFTLPTHRAERAHWREEKNKDGGRKEEKGHRGRIIDLFIAFFF